MRTIKVLSLFVGLSVLSSCSNAQSEKVMVDQQAVRKTDLSPAEFKAAIANGPVQLVDVRTPGEFKGGHLEGSVNIDWSAADYEAAFAKLDPKVPVLLYCQAGGRSEQALEHLREKGYQVQHLEGGFSSWTSAGLPAVK